MVRPDLSESDKAMERVVKGLVPLVVVVVATLLIFGTGDDGADQSANGSVEQADADKSSASERALSRASYEGSGSTRGTAARERPAPVAAKPAARPAAAAPQQVAARVAPAATRLSSPERRYVTAGKLNIRSAPKSGEVVARARKGDTVKVYATGDGWARISAAGKPPQWVAERLVSKKRPPIDHRVITDILKVRTAPVKGKIVASARRGEKVRVYAFEKRWARISPDGKPGRWVSMDYLSRTKLPAEYFVAAKVLKLRAAPKTGKVVERIERGTPVKVYSVSDGWARLTETRRNARWASLRYLSQIRTFE